jgi:hypothetical protein
MEKELSYLSPEGHTVFTSRFLKNRGSCCRSSCLHCPYGLTVKKLGIQFDSVDSSQTALIEEIMVESGQSLIEWQELDIKNIKLIKLKDSLCGVLIKNHIVIKHLYLKKYFQHQGLSRELIEAYLF